jgi:phage-related protein
MAPKPVTLTFAGDAQGLERTFDKVGAGAKDMAADLDTASSQARSFSGALDATGNAAGGAEGKFMGTADVLDGLGGVLGVNTTAATGMMRAWGDLSGGFSAIQPLIGTVTSTIRTGLGGALSFIAAHPVLITVALLTAAVVLLWQHSETFRDIVRGAFDAVFGTIQGVWNWVKDNWPLLLGILTGPIGLAVVTVAKHWDTIKDGFTAVKTWIGDRIGDIVGFFTDMPGKLARAAAGLWDFFYDGFREAYNSVARFIRGLDFTINVPDILPGPDKYTIGFPDLPLLGGRASGGPVHPGGAYMVGERGPELFVPGAAGNIVPNGGGGGGLTVIVNALDPVSAATAVVRAIEEYEARNGTKFARTS